MPRFASAIVAGAAGFSLRAAAIRWKLALPAYRGLGDDRFNPITYKDTWKVVRDIAVGSGTPYNKAAYDAETRREAEAAAKKEAAKRAKEAPSNVVPNAPKQ